ncbi:hypothetical protein ACHAXT_008924 [Thalassiosira profunda]
MATAYSNEDGLEDVACLHFEELLNMITSRISNESKRHHVELRALRRVRANICTKLARGGQVYVRVILHGRKPKRFEESTSLPTFFEWDAPSICRVSKPVLLAAARMMQQHQAESWEESVCEAFAQPLIEALRNADADSPVVLRTQASPTNETETYISAIVVQKASAFKSRRFFTRQGHDSIVNYSVAHKAPHALSRQRQVLQSEVQQHTH